MEEVVVRGSFVCCCLLLPWPDLMMIMLKKMQDHAN